MQPNCEHIDKCREQYPSLQICPDCQRDLGFPNVRQACKGEKELLQRYKDTITENAGNVGKIREFEESINQYGSIVIAVRYEFLLHLLNSKNNLYANYHILTDSNSRLPAAKPEHQRRVDADNQIFPGYGRMISFGALSLNQTGAWSYGPCHISLTLAMVSNRTTFTQWNTYRYQEWFEHDKRPDGYETWKEKPGYRSDWQHKAKLAVAKLADELKPETPRTDFAGLLLKSDGGRGTDEFVEAHIYGSFTLRAISCVRTPTNAEAARFDRDTNRIAWESRRKEIKAKVAAFKKDGFSIDYQCGD